MSATEIRDLALQLPPQQRASLARDLLASLEEAGKPVEAEWAAEAESRAEAYAAGQVGTGIGKRLSRLRGRDLRNGEPREVPSA